MNVYERTYRSALQPGWLRSIVADNKVQIDERWVLINNVDDRADAAALAAVLVATGELTGSQFVDAVIGEAMKVAGISKRALRRRGYFLDYGLVMTITGTAPYLVGWDPETELDAPADWITPGIALLERDPSVFSVSPRWPAARDTLYEETVSVTPPWARNYGFSDQVFLVRRNDVAAPIYKSFAPASLVRNFNHPFSFEARIEAHQRASGRTRATHTSIAYTTNDLADVIARTGGYSRRERIARRVLISTGRVLGWLELSSPRYRLP